jgi:hypothetical protein
MVISQNLSFFKKFAEADISEIFGNSANFLFWVREAIFDFCSISKNRQKISESVLGVWGFHHQANCIYFVYTNS